ncbi:bifunctional 5,10-methylenetetrahydrofolate dehydrogenase/5,10-methenyltetrahydrofolate cyclohydrolase [Pseudoruegeria sp. HB172150]|uniref:bifunctional 5,10-methylenetetrahydrofolate dehydrogenase/5,10-methenyltetrahydrofolate cyclohydrolase n=1 Tax=Pseudoruegeria sp. HB172150 TaxID=2721164 RepID=UPI0015521D04|nr:bifunctional 5,10-methylenetetrahydrofolate dehydrogenase/5,10-methenyltetrahydrofolate cyclohydrolase [Pseudoruegeria sp. HB172150]
MAPVLLDGDALAASLRREMAQELAADGLRPRMATVLVGDDPASRSYIGRKHFDCDEIGIDADLVALPSDIGPERLMAEVACLNADASVDGFFVQFPLPDGFGYDELAVAAAIDPEKDIDGLAPVNLGRLMAGAEGLLPCTPAAILALLRGYDVPLAGRHVVIIGRGLLVGRPLVMLLSAQGVDATVSLLNSRTPDLGAFTRAADVVIAAAGVPDLVTAGMLRPGAAAVGVGITYDDAGNMVSDLAGDVTSVAGHVTPPHGSVGALTRAMLLRNLITAARRRRARNG